jgi:hypothetical protein
MIVINEQPHAANNKDGVARTDSKARLPGWTAAAGLWLVATYLLVSKYLLFSVTKQIRLVTTYSPSGPCRGQVRGQVRREVAPPTTDRMSAVRRAGAGQDVPGGFRVCAGQLRTSPGRAANVQCLAGRPAETPGGRCGRPGGAGSYQFKTTPERA